MADQEYMASPPLYTISRIFRDHDDAVGYLAETTEGDIVASKKIFNGNTIIVNFTRPGVLSAKQLPLKKQVKIVEKMLEKNILAYRCNQIQAYIFFGDYTAGANQIILNDGHLKAAKIREYEKITGALLARDDIWLQDSPQQISKIFILDTPVQQLALCCLIPKS